MNDEAAKPTWPPESCACPAVRRHSFPGVSRDDRRVLRLAIVQGVIRPERWWFNVPCCEPPEWVWDPDHAPFHPGLAALYPRRIDLVSQRGASWWVVELKPLASPTAIGQALMYHQLACECCSLEIELKPVVICQACPPEIRAVAEAHGVRIKRVEGGTE